MQVRLPMQQQLLASARTGTLALASHRTRFPLALDGAGHANRQCSNESLQHCASPKPPKGEGSGAGALLCWWDSRQTQSRTGGTPQ